MRKFIPLSCNGRQERENHRTNGLMAKVSRTSLFLSSPDSLRYSVRFCLSRARLAVSGVHASDVLLEREQVS